MRPKQYDNYDKYDKIGSHIYCTMTHPKNIDAQWIQWLWWAPRHAAT